MILYAKGGWLDDGETPPCIISYDLAMIDLRYGIRLRNSTYCSSVSGRIKYYGRKHFLDNAEWCFCRNCRTTFVQSVFILDNPECWYSGAIAYNDALRHTIQYGRILQKVIDDGTLGYYELCS